MDNTLKALVFAVGMFLASVGLINLLERNTNILRPQCVIAPDVWANMNAN